MRIGLFGGSFDPPHKTHRAVLEAAKEQLKLDRLVVIPTPQPPHKSVETSFSHRFDMAVLAFGDIAEVSDIEAANEGLSYTYMTLERLRAQDPTDEYFLVIGGDSFADFASWRCPERIVALAKLAVYPRKGANSDNSVLTVQRFGADVTVLTGIADDVSSTRLRTDVEFGFDVSDRLDRRVIDYIQTNGLYSRYRSMIDRLRGELKPTRFMHTYHVVIAGLSINKQVNLDIDKVFTACLLHDCAKYRSIDDFGDYDFDGIPPQVLHQFTGEILARSDYGVEDTEVLDAIKYHCTGRPNMTTLGKLVFTADIIEETRGDCVKPIRDVFYRQGLEGAFLAALKSQYGYIHDSGFELCDLTESAVDYYLKGNLA